VFFIANQGCSLSEAVRPTACLIYPFDLTGEGTRVLQVDRFVGLEEAISAQGAACLAVQEAQGWPELERKLGIKEGMLDEWFARLREEVVAHRG
jgi:hypothetical protein